MLLFSLVYYDYVIKKGNILEYSKVAIIGAGAVGSSIAYALLLKDIVGEILLVDIDEIRCEGEVLDLADVLLFSKTSKISKGSFDQAAQADIIIISAGVAQKVGQDRTELLEKNTDIILKICADLQPLQKNAIVIVVTNPVDVITYKVQQCLQIPKNQIFSSGTYLDTMRLRHEIAKKLDVAEQSVDAYVLGEHGDSQFAIWSNADVAGTLVKDFPQVNYADLQKIEFDTKNRAYEIISCKGATYFGIAACITRICEAIIFDQKIAIPLSCYQKEFDLCISMPVILGKNGIEKNIPVHLSDEEKQQLNFAVNKIRNLLKTVKAK